LPLDGVSAWGALTTGKGLIGGRSNSNRTDIYHDICLAWMGGSCLERLDQEGGPFKEGAIFASMMRDDWKLMIGQNKNVSAKRCCRHHHEPHELSAGDGSGWNVTKISD
jgi:hypothetical protein